MVSGRTSGDVGDFLLGSAGGASGWRNRPWTIPARLSRVVVARRRSPEKWVYVVVVSRKAEVLSTVNCRMNSSNSPAWGYRHEPQKSATRPFAPGGQNHWPVTPSCKPELFWASVGPVLLGRRK